MRKREGRRETRSKILCIGDNVTFFQKTLKKIRDRKGGSGTVNYEVSYVKALRLLEETLCNEDGTQSSNIKF